MDHDVLTIDISPTSYRIVAGTNFANPRFAQQHGRDVMANPIGVSTLVQAADNRLLLGRRNGSVAYYPRRVHPFAGSMEVADVVDPFENVRRELREELSLNRADIANIVCLGVAEDANLVHPELLFIASATLTEPQIVAQLDPAEHSAIWSTAADRASVAAALHQPELTPIARAALTAWAENRL